MYTNDLYVTEKNNLRYCGCKNSGLMDNFIEGLFSSAQILLY